MFNTLHRGLGRATELVGAGRLMEATAAIQRVLGGAAPAPAETAPPRHRSPPTIDGTAEPVGTPTPRRPPARPHTILGRVNLRDLVRAKPKTPTVSVTVPPNALFLTASFTNDAGSRPYKVYVPSGYRAGRQVPLLVMLHGCTQSPDDFAAGTRMNEIAEEHNILVVYPGQTGAANLQKCWNWFNEGDQRRGEGEPSLIAGITREIMARYAVDPKRVFIAGLSAGGAAAAIMGNAYPELYAAIGVHSGLACGAARDLPSAFTAMRQGATGRLAGEPRAPLRAIVFHGDRDSTVSPRNGEAVVAQSAGDSPLRQRVEKGQVQGGRAYTRAIQINSAGRIVVEHWVLHGASHAWAGGSPAGSYTDPHGPDASREMVRFFLEITG